MARLYIFFIDRTFSWLNFLAATAVTTTVTATVGYFVLKRETRLAAKEVVRLGDIAALAEERANTAEAERLRIEKGHNAVLGRLSEIEQKSHAAAEALAILKTEMLPVSEVMKLMLIKGLEHPSGDFQSDDRLLEQARPIGSILTLELAIAMGARQLSKSPHVSEQEKLYAKALPIVMEIAAYAAKVAPDQIITTIQLVSSTERSTETKRKDEGAS